MRAVLPVPQGIPSHRLFRKRKDPFLGINNQTWQAAALLVLAIVISLQVNRYTGNPGVPALLQSLCAQRSVQCHASLGVALEQNRTVLAQHGSIAANQIVLQIPNDDTIWDIDALRDPWIYHHVLLQQHTRKAGVLASAAYLGLYLARLFFVPDPPSRRHSLRLTYLSTLPQTLDAFRHHPVVWSEAEVDTWIGRYTSTYHHVREIQYQLREEYDLLTRRGLLKEALAAPLITWEQYLIGRLNVLTRSFGTGPLVLNPARESNHHPKITMDELQYYQSTFGVDLSNGCHVMVPILDQLNHHGQQHNVGFRYDDAAQGFVVTALRTIVRGAEVMDHYGKRTHADLFAKYGFIQASNPTGDYSEATIALWHSLHHPVASDETGSTTASSLELQYARQMLRYLQYDDGYDGCVVDPASLNHQKDSRSAIKENDMNQAWTLKQLKYQHMLHIVGHASPRWVLRMPPSGGHSSPLPKIENWHKVLSTCRLMVLTHQDYNATAIELLQSNRHNTSFYLFPESTTAPFVRGDAPEDALEFRTYMCMARMVQSAMSRFPISTVDQQLELLATLPQSSRNWTRAQLHLQELRTLDAAKQILFHHLGQKFPQQMMMPASGQSSSAKYSLRDEPCSFPQLQPLLRHTERQPL
jgi:hypothetical protein